MLAFCVVPAPLALIFGCEARRHEDELRPNVVLIVLDTTRVDFLSTYGFPQPTTPNIDEVAKAGVRFDRAYATGNWTVPSHASLLTGRYPSDVSASWQTPQLHDRVETLAEVLRGAGYATRAAVENPWVRAKAGFGQGFDVFRESWRQIEDRKAWTIVDEPVQWIAELASGETPFFIFLNYNRVHMPRLPIDPPMLQFLSEGHSSYDLKRLAKIKGDLFGDLLLQPDEFRILRELYAGELHIADMQVGKVLDELERRELLDDTLIIITADHGELIGERGRLGHSLSMTEQTLHVPLIIRYPGRFDAETVNRDLVSLVDIMPTVLDVTGVDLPEPDAAFAGSSLAIDSREPRRFVVAEDERPLPQLIDFEINYPMLDRADYDHPTRTIVTDRYKLVWKGDRPLELYDLESDPAEQFDLREGLPEVEERLLEYLSEWKEMIVDEATDEALVPEDPEALENLKALGYFQ